MLTESNKKLQPFGGVGIIAGNMACPSDLTELPTLGDSSGPNGPLLSPATFRRSKWGDPGLTVKLTSPIADLLDDWFRSAR